MLVPMTSEPVSSQSSLRVLVLTHAAKFGQNHHRNPLAARTTSRPVPDPVPTSRFQVRIYRIFTVKLQNSCSANVAEFQRDGKFWSIKLKQVIGPITDSIPLEHSTSEHDRNKSAVSGLGTRVCLTRDGSSFRTVLTSERVQGPRIRTDSDPPSEAPPGACGFRRPAHSAGRFLPEGSLEVSEVRGNWCR